MLGMKVNEDKSDIEQRSVILSGLPNQSFIISKFLSTNKFKKSSSY